MENFQKGFVSFIASFISSQSDNPKTREVLVRRMMRMKNVQKIIIDSMVQLSSIIDKEILSIENIRSLSSSKITPKNSKLLILAEEVKNIMNNYIFIQSKVSDMRDIIEKFDDHIEVPSESTEENKIFTSAYQFLSSLPQNPVISNSEIEAISQEIWSKQLEVETMLKVEVEKLREYQNSIESRYFNKLYSIKTKAGLKIHQLENKISALITSHSEDLNRSQMQCEELLSFEFEKSQIEVSRLNKICDTSLIKDLPEAFSKIKDLLRVKDVYEKKRSKDEKLIKGLNSKLQVLINSYEELNTKHAELEDKFQELSRNHESLVESSYSPKNRDRLKSTSRESVKSLKIEQTRTEVIFTEFPIKNENIIEAKILTKPRHESTRVAKLEKEKRKLSPKKKIRTATPSTRSGQKELKKLQEKQGSDIKNFKQALIVIDERFKETNKALIENLEELVDYKLDSEISKESKDLAGNLARPRRPTIRIMNQGSPLNTGDMLFQIEEEVKLEDKDTQVLCLTQVQCTQTVPDLLEKIEDMLRSQMKNSKISDIESLLSGPLLSQLKGAEEKSCQTEKDFSAPLEARMGNENELIRGLLTKKRRNAIVVADKEWNITNIVEKIIKIPAVSQNIEEVRGTHITDLLQATEEYKKEFLIQTQLRGFKRLEQSNVQELWEEIIQRRISQGEQDKISVYLRGLLGTETFEKEKKSVIEMIETSKMHDFKELISKPEKKLKKKQSSLKNWKKIMNSLLSKYLKVFIENFATLTDPKELLFQVAIKVKFVKHRLKRNSKIDTEFQTDSFGFAQSDKWVVRSITPVLVEANRVKSRYLQPRRNMTAERFKRPRIVQYRNI